MYDDIWCLESLIDDSEGREPNVTLSQCESRCIAKSECNYILYGDDVFEGAARCVLFQSCARRDRYQDGNPIVYLKVVNTGTTNFEKMN